MKRKLGGLLRVIISVGILAYLFNSIFHKEAAGYFESYQIDPSALSWMERARIVWSVGPQSLWDAFQKISPSWFALAVICAGIPAVLGVIRWRWILKVQGLEVRFSRLFSISFIGLFFNAFMLGSTGGDVIKAWYVAHETHHKKAEAVATVVVDRLIGLLALFIITLIMMTAFHHRVFDDPKLFWFSMATLGVVVSTVLLTIIGLWRGLADKLPGLRAWLKRMPRYETLRRMVDAYRVYASHPVVLGKTLLISFAVHFFSMLSIVCVGYGLGARTTTFLDYYLYLPIINSVTAVPITISGFGVREAMYIKMFQGVGMEEPVALVMSLLGYLAALSWSIVGGGFFLTHRKELPPPEEIAAGKAA
ncbi:MAG TPA: lysylphosphatidylglycerol synthase transmembrane domain-containing protein [Verrucomicrobiae bacterium]|nr:lysylphosphatidylglycerol synthase transmembrane domain-containing protein [Verrucomicrobiae bacterium]